MQYKIGNQEEDLFKYSESILVFGEEIKVFTNGKYELFSIKKLLRHCKYRPDEMYNKIDEINVYKIRVLSETYTTDEMTLVTELGVYQLLMVMNNNRSRKFRQALAIKLNQMREERGLSLEEFVEAVEYNINFNQLQSFCDNRVSLYPDIYDLVKIIDYDKLYILDSHSFPVLDNKPIKDEFNDEYYIKHIDKVKLGHSIQFILGYKYVVKALAITLGISDKLMIEELKDIKPFTGINVEDNIYCDPRDILKYIKYQSNNKEHLGLYEVDTWENLFSRFMDLCVESPIVAKVLTDSVLYYYEITENYKPIIYLNYIDLCQERDKIMDRLESSKLSKKDIIDIYLKK